MQGDATRKVVAYSEPEFVVSAVLDRGQIKGYLFAEATLIMNENMAVKLEVPSGMLLQHSFNSSVLPGGILDQSKNGAPDVAELRSRLAHAVNRVAGQGLSEGVLLQQVNFLPRKQVRSKSPIWTLQLQEKEKMQEKRPGKKRPDH